MLLQKFLLLKDKYSISINEIEDLFDIEKAQVIVIYMIIYVLDMKVC